MRAFLIACVLVFTLLTFYSALWYKSEVIEADITTRVNEDLAQGGAKDVAVDVDGRHVTLSGVVYDEATEASYLDTADQTYGALGPIDGLTYLSGGGFIKAVKSADGITLSGTVPSEETRAALVAAAGDATDGAVDDQLNIGGAAGDWQDEASFGLAQLSGLSAGALAVAPKSYTLSGVTDGDIAPLRATLAERPDWQSFVSSPAVEIGLNKDVERLNGVNAASVATIATLTGERATLGQSIETLTAERDGLNTSLATVTGERDTVTTELQALRDSLNDNQTSVASLNADLAGTRDEIAARDTTIEDLNGQVAGLTDQNTDLEAKLASQQAALNGDQSEFAALQEKLAAKEVTSGKLIANIKQRDVRITELEGDVSQRDVRITELESDVAQRDGKITELATNVAQRDDTIAELQTNYDSEKEAHVAADAQIDTLSDQLTARDQKVAMLDGQVTDQQGEIVELKDQLNNQTSGNVDATARIAALTASVAGAQAQASTLDSEVDDLKVVVAERDATIADLRNKPAAAPATGQTAEQCATSAGAVLENARINFRTATANIDPASVPTLERLTGIALACVDSGLSVEVGGHTDSQGSDENNQALSERRAQAILGFMSERGVPTAGLKAVGYGESKPIGDNATPEGRAQNRRISFDWQAR